jgi:formylmethanofuran dehydrogenase subunit E
MNAARRLRTARTPRRREVPPVRWYEKILIFVVQRLPADGIDPGPAGLQDAIREIAATEEEKTKFRDVMHRVTGVMRNLPDGARFRVTRPPVSVPERARVFPSAACERRGERVSGSRVRIRYNNVVCMPWFRDSPRG